jgi:[FeFe] hydrogenase H-cluster maturation GTPase HydF
MNEQPSGIRPHVVLLGRRNVGKSSLVNALTDQPLALVSNIPGTTADPVRKAFELLPFGPVVFVDTAGLDDTGELGELRVARSREEIRTADFSILVVEAGTWTAVEDTLLGELRAAGRSHLVVVNKSDLAPDWRASVDARYVSAATKVGIIELRESLSCELGKIVRQGSSVLGDLVRQGDLVVLVVPIDLEAPRGRLILPQVMTIRDLLDNDCAALVVKERELYSTLARIGTPPRMVICDSQVVLKVVADAPRDVPVTTFSILFARLKGDLAALVRGVKAIDRLKDGDRVLIAEACSHHPIADDIGRVKIPRWVRQYTGRDLEFTVVQGRDYPKDLASYSLVIHCGGCMITPRTMRARVEDAQAAGVPVTNYGVAISHVQGVLARVLQPLGGPDELEARGPEGIAGKDVSNE